MERHPASRLLRILVVTVTLLVCGAAIAGAALPATVARVGDRTISRATFDHWMLVAARGNASQSPHTPVIVPVDPPRFAGCVAQARRKIPSLRRASRRSLRRDCRQLFAYLRNQTLDFLIHARWYLDRARSDGIMPTSSEVEQAFARAKRRQFRSERQFRQFLRSTGQTLADVRWRVRVNLVYKRLLSTEHVTARGLNAEVRALYRPHTVCARYYRMFDCR